MGLVQHASNVQGSGTQLQVTFGANTTAGNCLIASIGSSANISSLTTNGTAENWTQALKESTEPVTIANGWFNWNTGGGQKIIDINLNSSGDAGADLFEWNGPGTSNPLDKTSGNPNASGSTFTSGTLATLTQASEVLFGNVASSGTPSGPSSPWTNESQLSFNGQTLLTGYQQVSATTGLAYSGTFGLGTASNAIIFSLKLSGGVSVAISAAVVKVAAQPLTPVTGAAIAAAVVKVAAQPVTPTQGPPIAAAAVHVAAQQLAVSTGVAIAAAVVQVAAQPLTPVIVTPELIISIAPGSGTDGIGDAYLAGVTVYTLSGGTYYATSLAAGAVSYYTATSAAGPWTLAGTLTIDIFGSLVSSFSDVQLSGTLEVSGLLTCDGDLAVDGTQITIGGATITATNFDMDPAMGTPPNYPLSGSSSTAQIAACVNAIISEMQNRGMIT